MSKNRCWLIILILIALALRLNLLGEQSLWYDEGVTWMLSQMSLPELIGWTAGDIQPPLYYLLIWTTKSIYGQSEWALRFPSVLFGVLNLPLVYVLAQRFLPLAPISDPIMTRPEIAPERSSPLIFPLIVTALFTISPLLVYYSQEARMYTLLTFEATLLGYLLLKILHPTRREGRLALLGLPPAVWLYALVGAAALYTHYFAAFLFIAHALYALTILGRHQATIRRLTNSHLKQLAMAFGGIGLLFLPWLPTLIARLGDDPSFWPGALKLDEILQKVLITFSGGETVFEQTGWRLVLGYMGFLVLAFGWQLAASFLTQSLAGQPFDNDKLQRDKPNFILFLVLWLLLPIIFILALTYQSPKFNPRYTLLAWPAFALITAMVLTRLINTPIPGTKASNSKSSFDGITAYVSRSLFVLFMLFILAASTFSLINWFTDPRFSKDDFKALAQFVRERKAGDETVLLSSGHLFPVWAYYSGWDGWTPLPEMRRLDVNQVTSVSIAANIAEAVSGYQGVWLVTWQDEVIDPNGVVPFWLDRIGRRPIDAGDFWGVGLEHWRLDPAKIGLLNKNPIDYPAENNFANQIELLGMTQLSDAELVLFWRPLHLLPDNLIVTLALTDEDGFTWSREAAGGRPGAYYYPPSRWPVGEVVMTHHQLPWHTGTPPGRYIAEIALGANEQSDNGPANAISSFTGWDILDEQGRPLRRTALVDSIGLSQLIEPESAPLPPVENPISDRFPMIRLRQSSLSQEMAQPGDRIFLALLWQAGEQAVSDVSLDFSLIDAGGQIHLIGSSPTLSRDFRSSLWKAGDTVLGQYWLDIPPAVAPGPATVQLQIIDELSVVDETFPFDKIDILPTERNFSAPASVDIPVTVDFSGQVSFIGADCPAGCRAAPGESITLVLYWRAETLLDINYTIFTHVLGPDESVLMNADHSPPKPTQGWVSGEIITDPINLTIPTNLASGDYVIEIGLYDATDPAFQRLPLSGGETRLILPQPLTVE